METGLNGSIPQMNQGGITPGQVALFHSARDIALIKDKTCKSGYGYLAAGTLMAVNSLEGDLYPYVEVAAADNNGNGKAYVTTDAITLESTVQVLASESYKFQVGDSLVLGADANGKVRASCPECGLTYFIDIQLRGALEDPVLTFTYWYDHLETSRAKNRLNLPGERHKWTAEAP